MKRVVASLVIVVAMITLAAQCYAEEYVAENPTYTQQSSPTPTPPAAQPQYKQHTWYYWAFWGGPIKAPIVSVFWFLTNIPTFCVAVGTFVLDFCSFFRGSTQGTTHWSTTKKTYVRWRTVFDNFLP